MSHNDVVLLLGSNINNPKKNILTAMDFLESTVGSILRNSEIIDTKPVEFDSYNNFCNIAVYLKTQLTPIKLLDTVKSIELKMGRLHDSSYYGTYQDRIIDIDIVLFNNLKFISKRLVIPHYKNFYEREFAQYLINQVR